MKKLFFTTMALSTLGFLFSCDTREENNISISRIKIDSVKIPQEKMDLFTTQTIKTYSTYASGCDRFYDYDYRIDNLNRFVTSYTYKENNACTQATYVGANQFNFKPVEKGTYTFKFWNGKDNAGNDLWITKTIVVE